MKAHIFQSDKPIREGSDLIGLCGTSVRNVVYAYLWDSDLCPEMVAGLTTLNTCRDCFRSFLSMRYIYGVVSGAEIRPEHERREEEEVAA